MTTKYISENFGKACDTYREQILEPIQKIQEISPFAAVTLSCCALDLLSHTYYNPDYSRREECFKKIIKKKLKGYENEAFADPLFELRCGLVHEFRTSGDVVQVFLTNQLGSPQFRSKSDLSYLLVDVVHFCSAVTNAFEILFSTEDDTIRRRFIEKAYIQVINVPPSTTIDEGVLGQL